MAKRDSLEVDNLFNEILELWVNGYSRKIIVQYCSENHDISERQVDNYLAKVYKEISNNHKEHRSKLINQAIRRYNDLYDRNLAIQDYRECRSVQDSVVKLFGLAEAQKVDHTSNGETMNIPVITWVDEGNED